MTTAAHPTQPAERPTLSIVKDNTDQPVEGTVVEHQGGAVTTRPTWLTAVYEHALDNRLYAPQIGRGYAHLTRNWFHAHRDYWPQQIATAEADLAAAADSATQNKARAQLEQHRANYCHHRRIHSLKAGGWGVATLASAGVGTVFGGALFDIGLGLAALGLGAWKGRAGATARRAPLSPNLAPSGETTSGIAPTAGDEKVLEVLKRLGFEAEIIEPLTRQADGTSTMTVDLDDTVTALKSKTEALAGALKRDITMVDVSKGAHASQAKIWLADTDPFATTRRTPLLDQVMPLDSWRDGIPIAYSKRGIAIRIALTNQSTVIGGRSRSGKGVGASNLIVGAAMDPLVNLRIVAGKHNGEWDPYARTGVAATYFKPSPERLLALLQGLLADKDRRERDLGKLAKSKLIHDLIHEIGGIEVLVIDELATYTRPGKRLRDEILAAIEELSQVALGAGILLVLITQYPEVEVLPQAISMNCGTKWAMFVENANQSNAILGAGQAGAGRDASKFDPPRPGLGWLVDPFAGVTDLARSFDLDEDERGEISVLLKRAAAFREAAGRLAGQWDDPIERYLVEKTGLSSAAGGPDRTGTPGRIGGSKSSELLIARVIDVLTDAKADRMKTEPLVEALRDRWYPELTPDRFKEAMKDAGAGSPVTLGPIGEDKNPRGFKLRALTSLHRP
ncbi:hypothetical protein OG259_07670 [Streptomyces sp. NBC_00250]|uniref:hypothetical protein n=1 Tax=Streptomyces sp. NBC_00250 TaxID=2903641 RepID=UPI002E2BE1A1|nr:hypothetical protein [Streptomyces sp. NBC_00250]